MNIQFNVGQGAAGTPGSLSLTGGSPGMSDAFQKELAARLESALELFGLDASQVTISLNQPSTTGQNRQNLVAPTSPFSSSITTPAAAPVVPAPDASATAPASVTSAAVNTLAEPVSVTSAAVNATTTPPVSAKLDAKDATTPEEQASYDDTYWDAQPPAVQQLRDIQDPEKRGAMAMQLADEGYKIDVPIMLWGWDPAKTMAMREADGYTWVPSAYQNPVEAAPGISYPGGQSYDPKNPPAGSILVS